MRHNKSFASDNNSGVHAAIMQALQEANQGHCMAYGGDEHTARAVAALQREFGEQARPYFVFLGTGANVLGLKAIARPHEAVVCAQTAHINVDECGAPEAVIGCKLLPLPHKDGRISPADIGPLLHSKGFEHHSQPRAVSITQCTELGSVYTLDEIRGLAEFAHSNDMYLHMDGARLANAAAALGVSLRAMTTDAGVDVLSFGGSKNGLMFGEAVIFLNPALDEGFKYLRKQGMQLASKMRFIAAQFTALLTDELWLENARQANAMAGLLGELLTGVPGVELTRPVRTNAVFATLPERVVEPLQEEYFFYIWDPAITEARWMCSFDTTEEDVRGFVERLRQVVG